MPYNVRGHPARGSTVASQACSPHMWGLEDSISGLEGESGLESTLLPLPCSLTGITDLEPGLMQ